MEENATKKDVHDILEAINSFANQTEERFNRLESDVGTLKSDVGSLKSDVGTLKSDVNQIKATMVTKAYLDDKLSDLKGDMVAMVRKEDTKVDSLTKVLAKKSILTKSESKEIQLMGPFPKIVA